MYRFLFICLCELSKILTVFEIYKEIIEFTRAI